MSLTFILFSILTLASGLFMMYRGIQKMFRDEIRNIEEEVKDLGRKQKEDHRILEEIATRR
ncbi:MAG TPA: hypothetical protein PLP33_31395 [Leptospiraceae bacterium]|nr:hypothetical protein [Leptospiraceae bacterium]HNC59968.1 hypothetical protein [Leptospiraceae bacterium]HNF57942.1 hypothetical protein [Leptospiraceae bacterium]HNM92290.1 hypothetical protein [Leptospiraceae bacterium]